MEQTGRTRLKPVKISFRGIVLIHQTEFKYWDFTNEGGRIESEEAYRWLDTKPEWLLTDTI